MPSEAALRPSEADIRPYEADDIMMIVRSMVIFLVTR